MAEAMDLASLELNMALDHLLLVVAKILRRLITVAVDLALGGRLCQDIIILRA
jgi:hypothetical protein